MLNLGGSSGSHLHLLGVHVTKVQQVLAESLSLICAKRLFLLLLFDEADSLATSPMSCFRSLLSDVRDLGGFLVALESLSFVMIS